MEVEEMEVQRTSSGNATVAIAVWLQRQWRCKLQGERREKWSCKEKWRARGRRKRKKGFAFWHRSSVTRGQICEFLASILRNRGIC